MREVILIEATLQNANMQAAHAAEARLTRANLRGVNFRQANLWGADLKEALLDGAEFDEESTLPDGTRWHPGCDLRRFYDPTHPEFWRSQNPHAPTYAGNHRKR